MVTKKRDQMLNYPKSRHVSFLYQQIDDWHYLQLSNANFFDFWSVISDQLKPSAIMIGSIAGEEQPEAMIRIGLDRLHRQTTRWGGTFTQVSSEQLVRLEREYEFCFLDSNTELTEELAEIAAVSDHYSLNGLVDLEPLIPFADACVAGLVCFYRDGRDVSVLSRSINLVVDLFRTQLKLRLKDSAQAILDTATVDQLSSILKLRDEFLTIGEREISVADGEVRLVLWAERRPGSSEACDITLQRDEMSISMWQARPLPKYLIQKNNLITMSVFLAVFVVGPIAALYGLFKLIGYIISLFR